MSHVEKRADLLVLLLPIYSLTSPGTIDGGLACITVLELKSRRIYGFADDAAPGHDCCSSDGMGVVIIVIIAMVNGGCGGCQ